MSTPSQFCSQFRPQQYQEQRERSPPTASISPYPTPPEAPPKDQYISPTTSDSGSDCAEPYGGAPAAKVFHRGQLHIHKAYTGPEPPRVSYVDMEASMTGTRRKVRWSSAGCAESTSYFAVITSAGGDHSDNKTAPGVSVGAQV